MKYFITPEPQRMDPCEFWEYLQQFLPCEPTPTIQEPVPTPTEPITYEPPVLTQPTPIVGFEPVEQSIDKVYYYHSDHLGSSTYVTDDNGRPVTYYDYLPFGEVAVEHNQTTNFNNGYKFNAKELDKATGMSYYGARYYDSRLSVWISVDPLSEMAPNWSPYRFGFNNPVNFIDHTGLFETEIEAWWHRLWNGNETSSEILYDEKRKEYYYTNYSTYIDEEGVEGILIDYFFNYNDKDGGQLIFDFEITGSIGVQLGVAAGFGYLEGGIITTDIGSIGYSNRDKNGFFSNWGDGKGHNFIGGGIGVKGVGISGKIDYVTKDMVPEGQILEYLPKYGDWENSWGVGPSKTQRLSRNPNSLSNQLNTGIGLKATNDKVLDLNVGAKAILGIEVSIKTGITTKQK